MKRPLLLIASMLLIGAFLVMMWRLVEWRFTVGDMYPPYSTLRSDPLGAKAFYDSLNEIQRLDLQRHLRTAKRLPLGASTTVFLLGMSLDDLRLEEAEALALERFAQSGGRLVLALSAREFQEAQPTTRAKTTGVGSPRSQNPTGPRHSSDPPFLDIRSRWGFAVGTETLPRTNGERISLVVTGSVAELQGEAVAWRSGGVLFSGKADWRGVLSYGSNLVVIQRPLGLGSVVVLTDSYPLSNEGLRANPVPNFLAWLVGSGNRIVFDEAHLGILEAPGAAALARRYRLELPLLTLCVLAALVVWHGAACFQPKYADHAGEGRTIRGRSMASGLVGLLRRSIPPNDLLAVCLREWKHSRFGGRAVSPARLTQVQAIINRENHIEGGHTDPVKIYREIASVLSDRSPSTPATQTTHPDLHDH